ncbi:YcnI family protein [Microbacterium elymi]|uniref:YcnI family protein n=1 Tax=Microbacterium elymi TaxID=2909587 RepID=A0ABY5NNB7_9MICO|nr:YcnI family protein [Microbacterium elymi]UUT36695.1 YcnI family protein [Microbacterium elymi]
MVTVPDGVGNVTPVVEGGWSIQRTLGDNGVPTTVTYTADTPIETGLAASVSMEVLFDSSAQGETIRFPVVQKCVTGSTSWSEVPEKGQTAEDLDHPAPAVTVGPKAAQASDGHGSSTTDATADAAPEADPVARWLGAGGLAAGVIALVVAIVAATRRRGRSDG